MNLSAQKGGTHTSYKNLVSLEGNDPHLLEFDMIYWYKLSPRDYNCLHEKALV